MWFEELLRYEKYCMYPPRAERLLQGVCQTEIH